MNPATGGDPGFEITDRSDSVFLKSDDATGGAAEGLSKGREKSIHQPRPTILLVDDNQAVRQALRTLLVRAGDWKICGEAATGAEAIEKSRELRPDLILLDISLPDFSGLEAASAIMRDMPEAKILVVSQHDPDQMLSQAMASGARGYVTKARLVRDLVPALRSLLAE